ncbi:hypothetical protein AK812_SmicGene38795 [Symbiodinium microadriaticum]|uniref:Uncharacterized protein n=1 Tax=Symbiodinium microadriaticum TaxID=2951 RepID=A0A1Q9CCU6_SYMMI|nr:hypothetical protein AK812_SmicGene38795 [Symbiodinium microadriaticum]
MLAALAEPVLVGALERRIAQLESQLEGIPEITDAQALQSAYASQMQLSPLTTLWWRLIGACFTSTIFHALHVRQICDLSFFWLALLVSGSLNPWIVALSFTPVRQRTDTAAFSGIFPNLTNGSSSAICIGDFCIAPPFSFSRRHGLRFVLRLYFELWYLSDSPLGRLVQGESTLSAARDEDFPLEISPGVFCLGPCSVVEQAPQSQHRAARLAELLNTLRVERVRFLKRMVVLWHSTVMWQVHLREMAKSSRTAPLLLFEPETEPEAQHRVVFLEVLRDLRALYRAVLFLTYADIRVLRCFMVSPGNALSDAALHRDLTQGLDAQLAAGTAYFDFFVDAIFYSLATVLQCLMSSGPEERVAAFKGLTVHQLALLQDDIRAALLNVDTGRPAPASSSDAPASSTAPRPAQQPAATPQEEEDDDYAQRRLGRDYDDDWDRGAPSTAPRSQPAPAPHRHRPFLPARQSYDDYDRRRAETERIWANADFDEPDRYWQQPHRPRPATWSDRPRPAPQAQDDAWAYAQAAGYGTACTALAPGSPAPHRSPLLSCLEEDSHRTAMGAVLRRCATTHVPAPRNAQTLLCTALRHGGVPVWAPTMSETTAQPA